MAMRGNEAAKLEALCKPLGAPVLASQAFAEMVEGESLIAVDRAPGDGPTRRIYRLVETEPEA